MSVVDTPRLNIRRLGEILKRERVNSGMTVDSLARAVMVSPMAVYKWERGLCAPTIDNLIRIAFIMELSVDDLLFQSTDGVLKNAQ